jgi:hypothetical protein
MYCRISIALLVPVVALMMACATSPTETSSEETSALDKYLASQQATLGPSVEQISEFRLNGWNYVDRQRVILTVGVNERYLVELRTPCHGLIGAETIGFSTTTSYLTRFDYLLVRDRASQITERCYIDGIYKMSDVRKPVA